ncbi:hypothetical protein UK99_13990 [Frankia casuarinae]|nr:hypothetical protein UK99_13990 [Frankia casuarinae]
MGTSGGDGMNAVVLRGVAVAAGLAAIGYGVDGVLTHQQATRPPNTVVWLIGGVLVHDALLVPATMLVGFLLTRLVPPPYRSVAQGALLVNAAVALSSLPLWRGYGGDPGNPTVNPLPYGRNLALVLAVVWAGAAALMVSRAVRARRGIIQSGDAGAARRSADRRRTRSG